MNNRNRILYLDYVKGVSIILMLFTHTYVEEGALKTWIFAFHMPVFFVICGYLAYLKNPNGISWQSCKRYLLNRRDNMLKPYLLFGAILVLFYNFLSYSTGHGLSIGKIIDFLTLQGVDSMWFLPVYFYAEFLFLLSLRFFGYRKLGVMVAVLLGLFCCCEEIFPTGTFMQVKLVLIGFVFVYVGYLCAMYKVCERIHILLLPVLLILFSIGTQVNGFSSMYGMGTPLFFFSDAFGLSLILLALCHYWEVHSKRQMKGLLFFGRNSLIALCTNNLLIELFRLIDFKLWGGKMLSGVGGGLLFFAILFLLEIPIMNFFEEKFRRKVAS